MYRLREPIQRTIQRAIKTPARRIQHCAHFLINLVTSRVHLVSTCAQHTRAWHQARRSGEEGSSEVDGGFVRQAELACGWLGSISCPGRRLEAGDVLWEGTPDSGGVAWGIDFEKDVNAAL